MRAAVYAGAVGDGDGDVGDAGVAGLIELPAGWTETSNTTATYGVIFDYAACTPVVAGGSDGGRGDVCQR